MSERMDTLQQYVSDMLAVEKHIHEAVRRQEDDDSLSEYAEASALISQAEETLDQHIASLEEHLGSLGGDAASPVKDVVSEALGSVAGMINKVRTQQVSKMLRDDYAAFSLAAISYHMLHTTALAMGDQATADLALRHLKNWTPIITDISHVVHGVVQRELEDDAPIVNSNAAMESERLTQEAWNPAHVS